MPIAIRKARLIDPAQGLDRVDDLFISAGRIAGIGTPPAGVPIEREIDARGLVLCPGLVDLAARLREPGGEHKGTIETETRAAARGGITTLCCPPDTTPVIDTPAVAELVHQRAERAGYARVLCLGALTRGLAGEHLAEMAALKAAGCIGVSNALLPIKNSAVLRRALEYAADCGLTVYLHPEDPWLAQGVVHEGAASTRLGLPAVPESAETVALSRDLLLVEQTGVRAHFCRLSSARGVAMIAAAQRAGLPVSADVSIQHLHLADLDVGFYDSYCHLRPPLRSRADLAALRQGLADGVITAICSDHQPHDRDAKAAPFEATEPGASALEVLLPLSLHLADAGVLDLHRAIACLTVRPAEVLGIESASLRVGGRADLCLFDPAAEWVLSEGEIWSHGKNTPFLDWHLKGRVTHTLLGGRIVYAARESPP